MQCQLDLSEDCIRTKVWKHNTSHPLADHVAKHRNSYVSMVQCSSHISYQLPNNLIRVRKLIRSVESSDPKLLVTIAKVEKDESLKSDFEGMSAYVLLCDHVANNKANSNKTEKHSVSDASVASMVGGRKKRFSSPFLRLQRAWNFEH